ncbi:MULTISPECIES: hypothetical protein [Enterococcus]|nr:hypothetical protein [Enterococcus mundtii]
MKKQDVRSMGAGTGENQMKVNEAVELLRWMRRKSNETKRRILH